MHIVIPHDQCSGDWPRFCLRWSEVDLHVKNFLETHFENETSSCRERRKGLKMIQDQYLSKTSGLICGEDNCNGSGFDSTDDCCVLPIDQGIYFWQYSKGFVRRCKQVTFSWKVEFYFMKMFQTGVKPTETAERIIFTLAGTFNYLLPLFYLSRLLCYH